MWVVVFLWMATMTYALQCSDVDANGHLYIDTAFDRDVFADRNGCKCPGLTSLHINAPDIPRYAFYQCNVDSLYAKVTNIGIFAFFDNPLTNITIDSDSYGSIRDSAFEISIYARSSVRHLHTSVHLTGVWRIEYNAFDADGARTIKDLTLDNTLTEVWARAFAGNNIENLVLPNSLRRIDDFAFYLNLIKSVVIPNSVKKLSYGVFLNNPLTSVVLPNSATEIDKNAFANTELRSVDLPNGLKKIKSGAFSSSKLTSLVLPNSVTEIGKNAFSYNQLESVVIPSSVTSVGANAFSLQLRNLKTKTLKTVTIQNDISNFDSTAFGHNVIETVRIDNDVNTCDICFPTRVRTLFGSGTQIRKRCQNTDGTVENPADCICDDVDCTDATGHFCHSGIGCSRYKSLVGRYEMDGVEYNCPAGRYSTALGTGTETPCTRCPWGTFSNSDRLFNADGGKMGMERFLAWKGGLTLDGKQDPSAEQYFCETCPAGWDGNARFFIDPVTNESSYLRESTDSCTQCIPGTYSARRDTGDGWDYTLGGNFRYYGTTVYGDSNTNAHIEQTWFDSTRLRNWRDGKSNTRYFYVQTTGCAECSGEGEYQDEYGGGECKTCAAAGLQDTPLANVTEWASYPIKCVHPSCAGKSGSYYDSNSNYVYCGGVDWHTDEFPIDGYLCRKMDLTQSEEARDHLTAAHRFKWVKCHNSTSVLAPIETTLPGAIGYVNRDQYYSRTDYGPTESVFGRFKYGNDSSLLVPTAGRRRLTASKASGSALERRSSRRLTEAQCGLSDINSTRFMDAVDKDTLERYMSKMDDALRARGVYMSTNIARGNISALYLANVHTEADLQKSACPDDWFMDTNTWSCTNETTVDRPILGLTFGDLKSIYNHVQCDVQPVCTLDTSTRSCIAAGSAL